MQWVVDEPSGLRRATNMCRRSCLMDLPKRMRRLRPSLADVIELDATRTLRDKHISVW